MFDSSSMRRLAVAKRSVRSRWTPSLARRLWRARALRLMVIGAAGLLGVSSVAQQRAALQAEVASWQSVVPVIEVSRFVPAGAEVRDAVRVVERPEATVPVDALRQLPQNGRAAVDLVPGEVLLTARVRGADEGLLPRGTVAITVELDGDATLVGPGSLVDLWATDAANFSSRRVARSVVVLHYEDRALTVAVPSSVAGDVAVASLRPLTVTLLG